MLAGEPASLFSSLKASIASIAMDLARCIFPYLFMHDDVALRKRGLVDK